MMRLFLGRSRSPLRAKQTMTYDAVGGGKVKIEIKNKKRFLMQIYDKE
jgi:hypothetical protein